MAKLWIAQGGIDLWCGRGDLNPHAFRRHPLKMVCLPIPPLPHALGATRTQDRRPAATSCTGAGALLRGRFDYSKQPRRSLGAEPFAPIYLPHRTIAVN